jgi:hypothetical protein
MVWNDARFHLILVLWSERWVENGPVGYMDGQFILERFSARLKPGRKDADIGMAIAYCPIDQPL